MEGYQENKLHQSEQVLGGEIYSRTLMAAGDRSAVYGQFCAKVRRGNQHQLKHPCLIILSAKNKNTHLNFGGKGIFLSLWFPSKFISIQVLCWCFMQIIYNGCFLTSSSACGGSFENARLIAGWYKFYMPWHKLGSFIL